MTTRITPRFGINELIVGNVHLITLKLRVKNTFPIESLPREVEVTTTFDKKGNCLYMLKYSAVITPAAKDIVSFVGVLLYQHALVQLEKKYNWVVHI